MTELEKYQKVNQCETPEQLYQCILDFADESGYIQGRTKRFKADRMVEQAKLYFKDGCFPNAVTREYGLRQQMMYIKHYL